MNLKKTGNPAQLNWKGPDLQLQLHHFQDLSVAGCHAQKKREN
jgi:hypothetical protein